MANSRADEMVLAGSAPTPQPGSDPVEHIHRGTSFIVLVDGAIVVFVLAEILGNAGILSTPFGSGFLATVVFTGLMVYSGDRCRKPWAYWPSVGVLFLATLVFLVNAFLFLYIMIVGGLLTNILFVVLFSWAALGSGRRALFHWHPGYRAGYLRKGPLDTFNLEDGEMLAACPTCLAVLAIRPEMLGDADRCPHCGGALVSQELIKRYNDEEA